MAQYSVRIKGEFASSKWLNLLAAPGCQYNVASIASKQEAPNEDDGTSPFAARLLRTPRRHLPTL